MDFHQCEMLQEYTLRPQKLWSRLKDYGGIGSIATPVEDFARTMGVVFALKGGVCWATLAPQQPRRNSWDGTGPHRPGLVSGLTLHAAVPGRKRSCLVPASLSAASRNRKDE